MSAASRPHESGPPLSLRGRSFILRWSCPKIRRVQRAAVGPPARFSYHIGQIVKYHTIRCHCRIL